MIDADDTSPRSITLLVIAAVSAAVTLLLAVRVPSALASFREVFIGFGVTIPPTTNMVLNAPYVWWVLAAAAFALFAWLAVKSRLTAAEHKRMKLALCVLIAFTVVAYGFAAFWLYLPIFSLGATV